MQVIIVGGGIAGLYLANCLRKKKVHVILLEKNQRFGGRIHTIYDKSGKTLYESGPWRVHKSQHRVRRLFKELGFHMDAIPQKKTFLGFLSSFGVKKQPPYQWKTNEITEYQAHVLRDGIVKANQDMVKTGYDNIYQEAIGGSAYQIEENGSGGEGYFVVPDGFSAVVKRLVAELQNDVHVTLIPNAKVQDISHYQKKYHLSVLVRDISTNNSFFHKNFSTKYLVLAVPPSDMRDWTISKIHLQPNLACLESLPLMHIMGKMKQTSTPFKYIVNNPLCQVVSSCFHNCWIQVSYSAGRFAMLWENIRLMDTRRFENTLLFFLKGLLSIEPNSLRPHFWRHAVHYWLPNRKMKATELRDRSIVPHWKKLPHLYWVGEAISTHQGWMEGALETVDLVMLEMNKIRVCHPLPKEYVIYDGRILDVGKWKHVHPGSKETIQNHLFQDITNLWNHYHPKEASKYFVGLQVAP